MKKISPALRNRLRDALSDCDQFENSRRLKTLFRDPRMEPWRTKQPITGTQEDLVNDTINLLDGRNDDKHNSAIVLLLYVLKDITHPETGFYLTLDELIKDVENELGVAPQETSPKPGVSSETLRALGLLVSIALLVLFSPPLFQVTPVAWLGLAGLAGLCLYATKNSVKVNNKALLAAIIVIITIGTGYGLYYLSVPHFKITALNTLEGDHNAYEFNDLLIMEYYGLESYGVNLALEVKVEPFYWGSRSRGKIVAYVSGEIDAISSEQILWMDFSRSSEAKTMTLSLPELLAVSGLVQNRNSFLDNLVRDAASPFQQKQVEVQIKSEDNQGRTWATEKLLLRNGPWEQRSETWERDDRHEVEFYLKNLGAPSEFGIYYNLVRLDKDIGSDDHPVWAGTTTIIHGKREPNRLIPLAKGEIFTETIILPDTLSPGRYVVEIYAIKTQNYIRFENPETTWDNYGGVWLFSDPSDQLIFVVPEQEIPVDALVQQEIDRLRDESGFDLGAALSYTEVVTSSRGTPGERQVFENGEVYVHGGQAYAMYGSILEHYLKLDGLEHRLIGFPVSAMQIVTSALGTQATMMAFEGTEDWPARFYASPQTTAVIWGAVAETYLETYGGPEGWLGFPLSDECYYTDSTLQKYEGGYMAQYHPWVDGERDNDGSPVAYPYLTSQGEIWNIYADKGWQNTGIAIKPDDAVRIIQVGGEWTHWEDGIMYDANGGQPIIGLQANNPLSTTVTGALIGRIGENWTFAVGRWLEMTASDAGNLYLAMNDNNYSDNQGFITVEIVVEPAE